MDIIFIKEKNLKIEHIIILGHNIFFFYQQHQVERFDKSGVDISILIKFYG